MLSDLDVIWVWPIDIFIISGDSFFRGGWGDCKKKFIIIFFTSKRKFLGVHIGLDNIRNCFVIDIVDIKI